MRLFALRGANSVDRDDPQAILDATTFADPGIWTPIRSTSSPIFTSRWRGGWAILWGHTFVWVLK